MFQRRESTIFTIDGYLTFKFMAIIFLLIETIISVVVHYAPVGMIVMVLNGAKVVIFLLFSVFIYKKESLNPPRDNDTDVDVVQENKDKNDGAIYTRRMIGNAIWLVVTVVVCVILLALTSIGDATGSTGINFALIPGIAMLYRRFSKWLVRYETHKSKVQASRSATFKYFLFRFLLTWLIMNLNELNLSGCRPKITAFVMNYVISNFAFKVVLAVVTVSMNRSFSIGDTLVDDFCDLMFAFTMSTLVPLTLPICFAGFVGGYIVDQILVKKVNIQIEEQARRSLIHFKFYMILTFLFSAIATPLNMYFVSKIIENCVPRDDSVQE